MDLLMNQESKQILAGRNQKYRNQAHSNFVEPDRKCDRNSDYQPSADELAYKWKGACAKQIPYPNAYLGFQLRAGSLDDRRQCFAGRA